MQFSHFFAACLAVRVAMGYLVAPPAGSSPAPETTEECSAWVVVNSAAMTCASICTEFDITLASFEEMNPITTASSSCTLLDGFAFCVQENFESSTSTTSSTTSSTISSTTSSTISGTTSRTTTSTTPITSTTLTTSTTTTSGPTTTTSGNGIATPTPYQANMTTSCDAFHLVVSGDQCSSIATEYGISLAEFYRWNPAVGTSCESLDLGYYVCVDIIGVTPTTTSSASATTTTSGNGITTPTPFQANMTTSCDTFHLVVSGDQCSTIVTEYGISLTEFYNWNPAVGTSCESLDLGDYVCVDIIGLIITTSPISTMPTTTGNGISTPTPYQTGMATNCDRFYLVVSGDECGTIASDSGISLADFYAWNPAVGTSCESLDLGDYVCIDIIGVTPSTTTPTTTTTAGNGITTPTPYQTGMATNCDSFHLVISGDECATIALEAGVSLADFYAWNPAVGTSCESLDLGDYVCIDIIGVTPTTSTTAPTTTSSNGVSTPTPFQAGMVTDCDSFHLVVSGDECGTIATDADITLTEFYDWNPAVGDTCATLDLGYYVCIGLL